MALTVTQTPHQTHGIWAHMRHRKCAPNQVVTTERSNLRHLLNTTYSLSDPQALPQLLQLIVDTVHQQLGARYAAISLPDSGEEGYTFVYAGMSAEEFNAMPHTPHHLGLLGRVLDQPTPVLIDDIASDPDLVGFPSGHPQMTRFLGAAIGDPEEQLGALYLADKIDGTPFTARDQQVVELFASHAALAIKQARLQSDTVRLAAIRDWLQQSLTLHDSVIQSLFAVSMTLHTLADEFGENSAEMQSLLNTTVSDIDQLIRAERHFINTTIDAGL